MDAPAAKTPRLAPDHHELYLLAAAIILGVLLGPAILGRLRPQLYDRLWVGSGVAPQQLEELAQRFDTDSRKFDQETRHQVDRLEASGVSEAAIGEHELARLNEKAAALNSFQQQRLLLDGQISLARQQRKEQLEGHLLAFVLAAVALMVLEALIDPRNRPVLRSRLASLRYVVLSLGLALLLAQPALLRSLPRAFTLGLIALAVLLALVPVPGLVRRGGE